MTDERISALASLLGVNVVGSDLLVLVDTTDMSMAPTGTDKSITITEMFSLLSSSRQEVPVTPDPAPTLYTGPGTITVTIATIDGVNADITDMTGNLTGTPNDGDLLTWRFLDDGAGPYTIAWGSAYLASTISLPVSTGTNQMLTVAFQWDGISGRNVWLCQGVTLG